MIFSNLIIFGSFGYYRFWCFLLSALDETKLKIIIDWLTTTTTTITKEKEKENNQPKYIELDGQTEQQQQQTDQQQNEQQQQQMPNHQKKQNHKRTNEEK